MTKKRMHMVQAWWRSFWMHMIKCWYGDEENSKNFNINEEMQFIYFTTFQLHATSFNCCTAIWECCEIEMFR